MSFLIGSARTTIASLKNGEIGTPGPAGEDGKTSYVHIAYSNSEDGSLDFSTSDSSNRAYIGMYTDFTELDSTDHTKYTWQRTKGEQGESGRDGVAGKDGVGLKNTEVSYTKSTNGQTPPESGWTEQVPVVPGGQFLWTKTTWTYTDNSSESGYSVAKMGQDGNKGDDGIAGKDGVGISKTVIEYAAGNDGVTKPTTGWTSAIPTVAAGKYLWTRTTWSYTDGTSEVGYTVAKQGEKGDKGDKGDTGRDGIAGKDGVGLRSTAVTYAASTSGTVSPSTGWQEQVPTVAPSNFLWTRTVWTYTDGTSETGYSVAKMGKDGAKGNDGIAGKDGVGIDDTLIEYAVSTSGTTKPASGWSTTIPSTPQGQYLWTRTTWTYTDNTTEQGFTVARQGEKGDSSHLHTAYAWSADGTDRFTTAYPNLNLLDGTKDFSGTWKNSSDWVTDGTYKGLTVKKRTWAWQGIYKTFTAPKDGVYTFSAYIKSSGNSANVMRYGAVNSTSSQATIQKRIGNNFDWTRDNVTLNLRANDSVWVRYEISGAGTDSILWNAGHKWEEGSTATPYMPSDSEAITDDYPSYIGQYTDFTQDNSTNPSDYTWNLVRGNDGTPAKLLSLQADSYVMKFDTNGNIISGQTISLSAIVQNMSGTTTWLATPYIGTAAQPPLTLTGSGNTRTLSGSQWGKTVTKVVVRVTLGDFEDTIIINKLQDGAKGQDGADGRDGVAGKDGVGLKSTAITYAGSANGTTPPSTGWNTQVPTVPAGQYLWTKTVWTYTDSSSETGYSVARMGQNGNNGKDGIAGKDGVGIKTTLIEYAVSTSGTAHPASGWSVTIPAVPQGQYLWTRTTWTYTDNTTEQGFTVARQGSNGANGAQGVAGPKGEDGRTPYFHTSYTNSTDFGNYDYSGNPNIAPPINDGNVFSLNNAMTRVTPYRTYATAEKIGNDLTVGVGMVPWSRYDFSKLTVGKQYSLTVPLRINESYNGDISKLFIRLRCLDKDNTALLVITSMVPRDTPKGVFTNIVATFTVQASTQLSHSWYVQVGSSGDSNARGTIDIGYEVKLEEGGKSTAYQPNIKGSPWYFSAVPLGENMRRSDVGNQPPFTTTEYQCYVGRINGYWEADETYTVTINATKPATQTFGLYLLNGSQLAGNLTPVEGLTDTWSVTFTATKEMIDVGVTNHANIFQVPQSTKGEVKINWVKIEKGSVPTPNIDAYKYLGTYTDFDQSDSLNPTKYSWNLVKGNDGNDGKPAFFHTAWANSPDGTLNFSKTDSLNKSYMGTYSDDVQEGSNDPSKYKWTELVGALVIDSTNYALESRYNWRPRQASAVESYYNILLDKPIPKGTKIQVGTDYSWVSGNKPTVDGIRMIAVTSGGSHAGVELNLTTAPDSGTITMSGTLTAEMSVIRLYNGSTAKGQNNIYQFENTVVNIGDKLCGWQPNYKDTPQRNNLLTNSTGQLGDGNWIIPVNTWEILSPEKDKPTSNIFHSKGSTSVSDMIYQNPHPIQVKAGQIIVVSFDYKENMSCGEMFSIRTFSEANKGPAEFLENWNVPRSLLEKSIQNEWIRVTYRLLVRKDGYLDFILANRSANASAQNWFREIMVTTNGSLQGDYSWYQPDYTSSAVNEANQTIPRVYVQSLAPQKVKDGDQWWKMNNNKITNYYVYGGGKWNEQTIDQSVLNIATLNAVNINGSVVAGSTFVNEYTNVTSGLNQVTDGSLKIENGILQAGASYYLTNDNGDRLYKFATTDADIHQGTLNLTQRLYDESGRQTSQSTTSVSGGLINLSLSDSSGNYHGVLDAKAVTNTPWKALPLDTNMYAVAENNPPMYRIIYNLDGSKTVKFKGQFQLKSGYMKEGVEYYPFRKNGAGNATLLPAEIKPDQTEFAYAAAGVAPGQKTNAGGRIGMTRTPNMVVSPGLGEVLYFGISNLTYDIL